ncbi:MAG: trehalose/maltose transport system substrate-binding protein [Solirubrobacteraceae bacterium]|jgi:multiple sugar transport system substrate-binding protein|nr:trehalose/maltose transport system substrate-binding protein [Solirubrobacteraceae bacterium]
MRRLVVIGGWVAAALWLAACGGGSSGGPADINVWVFNEPSGAFKDAAQRCTAGSNGRYKITLNALSNQADAQRQSLVRRLAAKDSSIDIAGLDVVWTAEFAAAGWIKQWPSDLAAQLKKGTLSGPLNTATYQGKLYAAPANSNTQLLWYRKDKVSSPPKTWSEMIAQATKLKTHIEIQGAQYEGVVVWFNSLVASAGGTIIEGNKVTLGQPAQKAADVISQLAHSPAADPSLASQHEDENRLAFEAGTADFEINYPFIYPSAKSDVPKIFKNIAWAPYPAIDASTPAKAPIGGINWGVGAYSKHPREAFEAAACMRNPQNEREAAVKGGLPPTLASLYNDPAFVKTYPFAGLIRKQLENGAVRPETPAYADVSLAIAKAVSPPTQIKTKGFVAALRGTLEDALKSRSLL